MTCTVPESINGFTAPAALCKLARDPRVAEIEAEGMEHGRVFIHLTPGYWFGPYHRGATMSVGSRADVLRAVALIEKREL